MQATAKHDFVPTDPAQELTFKKGDKLNILNFGCPVPWYNAESKDGVGLVPGNYIEIDIPSWYLGRIPRSTAEQMLANKHEGAFLVRLSESAPSEFSLSVKCVDSVQHFRILKDNDRKYFLWSERFNNINDLVEYYRENTVSRTSQIKLSDMDQEDPDTYFIAEAIYDFPQNPDEQTEDTELPFKRGDLITVFDISDEHWWGGFIGERRGYFPRLYVRPYEKANTNHP